MIKRKYEGKPIIEYVAPLASASYFIELHEYNEAKKEFKPVYELTEDGKTKHNPVTGKPVPILIEIPFMPCERKLARVPDSRNAINYIIYEETPEWVKNGLKTLYENNNTSILTREEYEEKYHAESYALRKKDSAIREKELTIAIKEEELALKAKELANEKSRIAELEKRLAQAESTAKNYGVKK